MKLILLKEKRHRIIANKNTSSKNNNILCLSFFNKIKSNL